MNLALPSKNPTISDREQAIEAIIESIQRVDLQTDAEKLRGLVLQLREALFPLGYKAKVQLEEDGRKKRSTADASYWSFHSGEMVLFFEPNPDSDDSVPTKGPLPVPPTQGFAAAPTASDPVARLNGASSAPAVGAFASTELDVQQCVQALEDAEKLGKQFISYKWFRDLVLAGLSYSWARDAGRRQEVLTAAIEAGCITVQKIPNPRSPMFPTTTLSVNRTGPAATSKSRFRPIQVIGEPVSTTLLRDRG